VPYCAVKLTDQLDQRGFTLIELVIIIVVLGILAAVAIPKFADMADSSRIAATQKEMQSLREAIIGNPQVVSSGVVIDRGFMGDVGFTPSQLVDLAVKPDSVPAYDKLTRLGWNGPYIDGAGDDYLSDAWGTAYSYDPAGRRIVSVGGSDSIQVTF